MATDVLAKTLEALRLSGTVYFEAAFHAPWGMAVPSRDVAIFHVVVAGECWLRLADSEASKLQQGDIVLLAHGAAHQLLHALDGEARPAEEVLAAIRAGATASPVETEGAATTLVCGHFEYDQKALHPFFETLPEVIQISSGESEQAAWLATASRLAAAETAGRQRGASAVVDRLAEALLMQTLRLFLDRHQQPGGFLAAVDDPAIGRVLSKLHDDPAREWSLPELAQIAGLSRSSFAERFRGLLAESPMRYLTRWRMLAARQHLRDDFLSTAQVAQRVGYRSEFAFAKAYKRYFGHGPGAARRTA